MSGTKYTLNPHEGCIGKKGFRVFRRSSEKQSRRGQKGSKKGNGHGTWWKVSVENLRPEEYNQGKRGIHSKNATILKAEADHKKEILRLMKEVFFKTDPSSVYSKVAESSVSPVILKMSLENLKDDVTFVAKVEEKEKIVGAAINAIRPFKPKPNFMEEYIAQVESKNEKILLELWRFISMMPPDPEKYFIGGGPLLEICYLVVDPEFRNQGIAKGLVNNSIKEADDKGIKFVRVDCTSHFTARIASAAGMDRIYEINYKDYKSPSGEHVFPNVTPPHVQIAVYARRKS